jgi:predicted DCC family thiol-disulfide oxidoreductase YuxK
MESAPLSSDILAKIGDKPLIVFDGLCVLCSANARFVLTHDRRRHFRLTTAQGPVGEALYRQYGLANGDYETMLVLDRGRLLTESDGAIAIARGLGWPWRAAAAARIVPKPLRNRLYRLVARNRYRWFGRRGTCWVPGPADADRIL